MPNKIPNDIIKQRKQQVLRLAEQIAFELREPYVSRKMTVLTESKESSRPGEIAGHTENFLNVWIKKEGLESNQLIDVELIANTPDGLIGRILNPI